MAEKLIEEFNEEDIKNAPKDMWICNICNSKNTNWRINVNWLISNTKTRESLDKFVVGSCIECKRKKDLEELEFEKLRLEKERRQNIISLLELSQMPSDIRSVKFDLPEFKADEEYQKCITICKRLEKANKWVCFWGDNNTGKTWLMGAAINHLVEKGHKCFYLSESQFFERNESKKIYSTINLLADVKYIFWDEFLFYTATENQYLYEKIYSMIEYCSSSNKIVIFGTNISCKQELNVYKELEYTSILGRCGKRILARLLRNETFFKKMENKPFF